MTRWPQASLARESMEAHKTLPWSNYDYLVTKLSLWVNLKWVYFMRSAQNKDMATNIYTDGIAAIYILPSPGYGLCTMVLNPFHIPRRLLIAMQERNSLYDFQGNCPLREKNRLLGL